MTPMDWMVVEMVAYFAVLAGAIRWFANVQDRHLKESNKDRGDK